jgi:hypothetical protein
MMENPTPQEKQMRSAETLKGKKKTYQKPAFRCERVFETAALSCGKLAGTSAICNSSRQNS